MKTKKKSANKPFGRLEKNLIKLGFSQREAIDVIQTRVDRLTESNSHMLERVDEQSSENSRARTTQLTTLATLLITVTGLFVSQQDIYRILDGRQKFLILASFILLFASICVGITDYFLAHKFFLKWRKGLLRASKAVDDGLEDGSIQRVGDMHAKYSAILNKLPESSGEKAAIVQVILVMLGAFLFVLLLSSVMYDFPIIK